MASSASIGLSPVLSPKQKRKIQVRVVNPLPGGSPVMSLYHAERYVRRDDARYDAAGRLVFSRQAKCALISAEQRLRVLTRAGYEEAANAPAMNLDAMLRFMRHVPIQRPEVALGIGQIHKR